MGILGRAVVAWWDDMIDFFIVNLLWLALTFTLIGLPPALAAMYQMAAHSVERNLVDWRKFLAAFRHNFIAAWRWGLLQLIIYGVGIFNFLYYSYAEGDLWVVLRLIWFFVLFTLTVLNIFYWPFFFQEEDRRIMNTYRNVLVMLAVHTGRAAFVVVFTIVYGMFSVMTGVLLTFATMPIITLMATLLVFDVLKPHRQSPLVSR